MMFQTKKCVKTLSVKTLFYLWTFAVIEVLYFLQWVLFYLMINICVTGMEKGLKRDDKVRSFCNNRGFQCGSQQMCRQTVAVWMHMSNGFPAKKMEQTIMTSLCDVMRISCARKGRELYKESTTEPQGCCYCIWVFWYKAFGLVSKPQTLYLGCLGALWGGSITRMNVATYLPICMHPALSGGFLVSTTSVVWWQPGRSLPSPLESSKAQITTLW